MKKFLYPVILCLPLALAAVGLARAEDNNSGGIKQDIKDDAHAVKHGAKEAWSDTKSGTKEAWHSVKHGAHKVKHKVKKAVKGSDSTDETTHSHP